MSRKVIGLDIRSRRICAVLVKSSLRESRVLAHRVVPIEAEATDGGGLAAALEIVRADLGTADADCAVCVPASLFSCRNLQVPFSNPQKIRMILPLELEAYLPQAAQERLIDFAVVENRPGEEPQTEVLVAAVEQERLAPVISALSTAGFDPERLTLSGMPAAVCLGRRQPLDELALCADVGETFGSIAVLAGDRTRRLRCFSLPGDPAARERAVGTHIRTMLGALQEESGAPAGAIRLFLTGDGIAGISRESLARALPVELQTADLRYMLNLTPEGGDDVAWDPALMNGALALALGEIEGLESLNFHRSHFPGRKLFARHRESLVRTGALAAAVLVLMFASILTQSYVLKRQAARLDAQIAAVFKAAFPEVKSVVDPYQQMMANLQELRKNAVAGGDAGAAFRSIDVLKNISEAIPEGITVVFDRMVAGPETILISGTTAAFNAVDEIKGHLERIPGFKKVTISSANTDRSGKEINFQLKVDL
ncbi:MAG: type II secretion system protein GspL [Desulfobacterales bacterium]